jgi:hypothetical protein
MHDMWAPKAFVLVWPHDHNSDGKSGVRNLVSSVKRKLDSRLVLSRIAINHNLNYL